MRINYTDADGRVLELEVSAEVGEFYLESIEEEKSNDRANTRRHTLLSTFTHEDIRFFDSGIGIDGEYAESDAVRHAFRLMTDRERFLLLAHYQHGRTYTEIAKAENKFPSTIKRETDKAVAKFKKIFNKF